MRSLVINYLFISILYLSIDMSLTQNYFAPSIFLNHGGGPNPVLGVESDKEIAESLRNVSKLMKLNLLKAIILVTAHREEDFVTISSGAHHHMVYDYYNFPSESYSFKHNASGDPDLAQRIHDAFGQAGIASQLDNKRGWDHGVFIPMMLIDPNAKIPIVQVSILKNQNARDHFEIGKVLYKFREEGVAIFGSGLSFHNMRMFRSPKTKNNCLIVNEKFDSFLNDVCTGKRPKEDILKWDKAPQALVCHPLYEADHLMPLIVCIGASGSDVGRNVFASVYEDRFLISGFMWGKGV